MLHFDEFRWLVRELVRLCSSKGQPLWVRTFRGVTFFGCWSWGKTKEEDLQYSVSSIASQELSYSERVPTVDGWFGVTKLLKEILIGRSSYVLAKSKEAITVARYPTSKPVSYSNVVRGAIGGVHFGS